MIICVPKKISIKCRVEVFIIYELYIARLAHSWITFHHSSVKAKFVCDKDNYRTILLARGPCVLMVNSNHGI